MKPTVGRVVHYQPLLGPGRTGQPWAAIITEVFSSRSVRLHLLTPSGQHEEWKRSYEAYDYSETPKPGHWNWPPREPAPAPDKRAVGGILPCNDPSPGDVGLLLASGSVEYVRPTSPIPDDAADRLRYLSRAPRKNGY